MKEKEFNYKGMMDKEFILLTEKGILSKGIDKSEIPAWLLFAFLDYWSTKEFNIDINDASEKIIDMLYKMKKTKEEDGVKSFYNALMTMFNDEDEEAEDVDE